MTNAELLKELEAGLKEKYFLINRTGFWGSLVFALGLFVGGSFYTVSQVREQVEKELKDGGLRRIEELKLEAEAKVKKIDSLTSHTTEESIAIGSLPVGTIVAWHKNINGGELILNDNNVWVECNGQTISKNQYPKLMAESIKLPNLNGAKRFLRGGKRSGVEQADTFRSHTHRFLPDESVYLIEMSNTNGPNRRNYASVANRHEYHAVSETTSTGGDETRPVNMSVVWIMRVQ